MLKAKSTKDKDNQMQKYIKRLPRLDSIDGKIGWFEICKDKEQKIGTTLIHDEQVDFAIIGAGIAGVSTAYALASKYPNATIALIEALKIGQGTSSRNAGFMIDLPHNLDGSKPNITHDKKSMS